MKSKYIKRYEPHASFCDLSDEEKKYYLQEWNKGMEQFFQSLTIDEVASLLISKNNYIRRKEDRDLWRDTFDDVSVGDVWFMDFGFAYFSETAYQHLALVIAKVDSKLLVVPMTSSLKEHWYAGKESRRRTLPFPSHKVIEGDISSKTTLLLNSATYVSSARLIRHIATLDSNDYAFKKIKNKTLHLMKSTE